MRTRSDAGITLIEVMIAMGILAFGFIPIFTMFSESRRVTTASISEMKATGMASSMIDGMMRLPSSLIDPGKNPQITAGFSDDNLPETIGLSVSGVPPAYPDFERHVKVLLVNSPVLPDERFSNPWGRIAEISVTITQKSLQKTVLTMKGYRQLAVIE